MGIDLQYVAFWRVQGTQSNIITPAILSIEANQRFSKREQAFLL